MATNSSFVLIDTSYITYFCASSSWNWWKKYIGIEGIKLGPSYDPLTDPEYTEHFSKIFFQNVLNAVQKQILFIDKSKLIFAFDCHRKNIWRKSYFPNYKISRDKPKDESKVEYNLGPVFKYAKDILVPNLCDKYGCKIIQCPHSEGDDIIGVLAKKISQHEKVVILADDSDFTQLDHHNIKQVNLFQEVKNFKTLTSKVKGGPVNSGKEYIIWKAIKGDGKDDIPQLIPRLGEVKGMQLLRNKPALLDLFKNNPGTEEQFKLNLKLLDFDFIPKEIEAEIITEWENQMQGASILYA